MFVGHIDEIQGKKIEAPGVRNIVKQVLIGPKEGWEGWVMRRIVVSNGGGAPRHRHPFPHINYILSGQGTLIMEGKEYLLEPGSIDYVPANAEHEFIARGEKDFVLICIVPEEGDI